MTRPNLFLIGAMKAGTSYLTRLLRAHPDIFMSDPKEPSHFVHGAALRRHWRWMYRAGYWSSESRYLALFERAERARVVGEASSVYSRAPIFAGVPERIATFNPSARYIYILRDPVERAISHYWHRVRGWRERRPMLQAVREDPQYLDASRYAMQLKLYLKVVPREQVLVLTLEELVADPQVHIGSVYAWLGVDRDFLPELTREPENVRPAHIEQVRGLGVLDRLRRTAACDRLAPAFPESLRALGRSLAVRRVQPEESLAREARDYLRPMLVAQTDELAELLGRRFPQWVTLYGASGGPRPRLDRRGGGDRSGRTIGHTALPGVRGFS